MFLLDQAHTLSGARTTKDIKQFARKTVDRLDDLEADIRDQVADWVDDMTEIVKDGVDRGQKLSTAPRPL